MIEALNKTIKHEFLYPKKISNGVSLKKVLEESVSIYNTTRTQKSLGGNTPAETHKGISIDFNKHKVFLNTKKKLE